MKESQYIRGWLNEGEAKGRVEACREDLLTVLTEMLTGPVPENIRLAVEGTNDVEVLQKWLRAAARSNSWAEFHAAMKDVA